MRQLIAQEAALGQAGPLQKHMAFIWAAKGNPGSSMT